MGIERLINFVFTSGLAISVPINPTMLPNLNPTYSQISSAKAEDNYSVSKIELAGQSKDINAVLDDLDNLVGRGYAKSVSNGNRHFLAFKDHYEGPYPQTFNLIKELTDIKSPVLLNLSSNDNPPKIYWRRYDGNNRDPTFESLDTTLPPSMDNFFPPLRVIQIGGGRRVEKSTKSGLPEVWYEPTSTDVGGLFMPSYIKLAHELGHLIFYRNNDPRIDDVQGTLTVQGIESNPLALGGVSILKISQDVSTDFLSD